MDASSLKAG